MLAITKETYRLGRPHRLMPDGVKPLVEYMLRFLAPTDDLSYAYEMPITLKDVIDAKEEVFSKSLMYHHHKSEQDIRLPMNSNGIILRHNSGPYRNPRLPEEYIELGYLLGGLTLTDLDLAELVASQPLELASV